ncbi:LytR/AlgR family response regulator transcription factor [Phenylobacterium sp.]|uniref:LytR/AlgR family response regulator transcription factor n=1 Tax=Phenylobacterium sp. TaxID=1871053 RepID=UPI003564132E
MWRSLFLAIVALGLSPRWASADPLVGVWEICDGAPTSAAPTLSHCHPLKGVIDPQGRELWLRAPVRAKTAREQTPSAVYIFGAASSEVWLNGVHLGANGAPGPTAAAERPGRYEAEFPIPQALWRPAGGDLIVRLSAFHVGMRFDQPVGGIGIGRYPQPSRSPQIAVTFAAAGALLAAFFGFGAVYAMRRTGSSLTLAAMAGVAALQAGVENYRSLVNYPYPFHVWRVNAIWALSAIFALLLAAFAAQRFLPRRRNVLLAAAAIAIPATYLLKGFDVKSGAALLTGVGFAGLAAAVGIREKRPGARSIFAYLVVFFVAGVAWPYWLLDLSFFVLAATLTLPLLVAEVVRLGREDRDREAALTRAASRPDRLTVTTARGVELTPLKDIVAILGADDYAELRLSGGRSLLHSARLERLETQLPPSFVRIHRSVIANLAHAERLERDGARWRLHMSEGPALPVSRSRLPALRDALDPPPVPLRAMA